MSYMKLAKLWYPLHLVQTELCKEQAYGTLTCSIKKNIKKHYFFSQRPITFPYPCPWSDIPPSRDFTWIILTNPIRIFYTLSRTNWPVYFLCLPSLQWLINLMLWVPPSIKPTSNSIKFLRVGTRPSKTFFSLDFNRFWPRRLVLYLGSFSHIMEAFLIPHFLELPWDLPSSKNWFSHTSPQKV